MHRLKVEEIGCRSLSKLKLVHIEIHQRLTEILLNISEEFPGGPSKIVGGFAGAGEGDVSTGVARHGRGGTIEARRNGDASPRQRVRGSEGAQLGILR